MAEQRTGPDTDRIPAQTSPEAVKPSGKAEPPAPRIERPATPAPAHRPNRVRRTRISGLWVGVTVAAIVLLVLLVFIIDNSQTVTVAFFGARGDLPLGVAMLLAAVCGILLVAIPGYARIIQLRRAARRR